MVHKLIVILCCSFVLLGCQFTETMVLNEDGSGTMTVEVNLDEMMAFGGMGVMDTAVVKIDTLINVKQFLQEKKDSIASLSKEEQLRLKKLENYSIHLKIDSEGSQMKYDISTKFASIDEVDDLMNSLNQAEGFVPGMGPDPTKKKENSPDIIGVRYSFQNGVFKRDAYIKDKKRHQKEVDSLQQSEAFLSGVNYTLKYEFPRPIKTVSDSTAALSNDKRTLILKKTFIEYFKDPDLLDLEVWLEE